MDNCHKFNTIRDLQSFLHNLVSILVTNKLSDKSVINEVIDNDISEFVFVGRVLKENTLEIK